MMTYAICEQCPNFYTEGQEEEVRTAIDAHEFTTGNHWTRLSTAVE